MNELLEKNQVLSVVPQDFRNSNKGKIVDIQDRTFSLKVFHEPIGIIPKKIIEFYSPTKNGVLYFTTHVIEVKDNILDVSIPRRHRFLQRRAFTRIKFSQDMTLELANKSYNIKSFDLSAGGMKIITNEYLDINADYDLCINLLGKHLIKCYYQPIKIEKNEDKSYTVSGRFQNLTDIDRMKIIQFCIRKNIENMNK